MNLKNQVNTAMIMLCLHCNNKSTVVYISQEYDQNKNNFDGGG